MDFGVPYEINSLFWAGFCSGGCFKVYITLAQRNNGGVTGFLRSLKISPCEERRLKDTLNLKCEDRRFQNSLVLKTEDLVTKPTKPED